MKEGSCYFGYASEHFNLYLVLVAEHVRDHVQNSGVGIHDIRPLTALKAARWQRGFTTVVGVILALNCRHGVEMDTTNSANRNIRNEVDRAIVSRHVLWEVADAIGQAIHISDSHEAIGKESVDSFTEGALLDVGLQVVVLTNLGPEEDLNALVFAEACLCMRTTEGRYIFREFTSLICFRDCLG